jgi:hypothetical protein
MLKSSSKPESDHVTHFWSLIEKPITENSIWECSYADDTIKGVQWCQSANCSRVSLTRLKTKIWKRYF